MLYPFAVSAWCISTVITGHGRKTMTVTAVRLRQTLGDTLAHVAYAHERVVVQKNGRDMAALGPIEDLKLLRALEDRIDLKAARAALAEPGANRSWADVKRDLGL